MKFLTSLMVIFLMLTSCGSRNEQERPDEPTSKLDTTLVSVETESEPLPERDGAFISFVEDFYFLQNDEVHVEAYFHRDNITWEDFEQVAALGDSLIFKDRENTRTRIPLNEAKKHFDLSGLDSIGIYNERGERVATADFLRVEYLYESISSGFIAVYRCKNKPTPLHEHFCVGNAQLKPDSVRFEEIEDQRLIKQLMSGMDDSQYSSAYQFKHSDKDLTISVINSNEKVMIFLTDSGSSELIYLSTDSESVSNILALPVIDNGLPLLLIRYNQPDGDMEWDGLLAFDGKDYTYQDRKRFELKSLDN